MNKQYKFLSLLFCFALACTTSSIRLKEEDKLFHAAPSTGGTGKVYFALYKDLKYKVCVSAGIGEDCYIGDYTLKDDTLILKDLNKDVPLSSNRLIILRYYKQDSSYWKWKYPQNRYRPWYDLKGIDEAMGGTGDVYELNEHNQRIQDSSNFHFVIKLDSLTTVDKILSGYL